MKIWHFIKWQWNKWESWQKWWIIMAFLFGAGISASTDTLIGQICLYVSLSIFFYFLTKWAIVEPVRSSWRSFKDEQGNLFDTIKNSDKK